MSTKAHDGPRLMVLSRTCMRLFPELRYNDETNYLDQRSWFTALDGPCFNPKLSLGAREQSQNGGGWEAGNSYTYGSSPG